MYLLKIVGVMAVSAGILLGTHRRLFHRRYARAWRVAFLALAVVGLGVGIWFLSIRRTPSSTEQAWGFPFTIAGGEFFDGAWHNGGVGRFLGLALLADVASAVALCTVPVALASLMFRRGPE
jgi:hypothetical protein